jgi:colanic acid biosynthesis glycosyl transferase WcaI
MIGNVENFFYKRSSQISVLSEGFKENLVSKGVPETKQTIIPACVDTEFIRPLPRDNDLRKQWDLADNFVVLYAGNIGFSQGLDIILKAAQLLHEYQDIVFALVGEGATKPVLQSMAEENGLNNVKFYPFLPRDEVPQIYALADVCLVSLKRDIVLESVPSKTYTIMASGRPIIATVDKNTEVGNLLNQAHCGVCIEPENPNELAKEILRQYNDETYRKDMGLRGRDYAVAHYARQVASKQYFQLIQRIVNEKEL